MQSSEQTSISYFFTLGEKVERQRGKRKEEKKKKKKEEKGKYRKPVSFHKKKKDEEEKMRLGKKERGNVSGFELSEKTWKKKAGQNVHACIEERKKIALCKRKR